MGKLVLKHPRQIKVASFTRAQMLRLYEYGWGYKVYAVGPVFTSRVQQVIREESTRPADSGCLVTATNV